MSEWDKIKHSKAFQDGRKEIRTEVEKMIKDILRPHLAHLDEIGDAVKELEKQVKAIESRLG